MSDAVGSYPDWVRTMLAEERVARLGFLDRGGGPRVLPIVFVLQGKAAWTAIDRKPKRDPTGELARLRFLRSRPEVALTVDRYDEDWSRLAWVQLLGIASIVPASQAKGALAALAGKYEQYVSASPPGPLIRIEPRRMLCWRAEP